jgi:hypothetical protein
MNKFVSTYMQYVSYTSTPNQMYISDFLSSLQSVFLCSGDCIASSCSRASFYFTLVPAYT